MFNDLKLSERSYEGDLFKIRCPHLEADYSAGEFIGDMVFVFLDHSHCKSVAVCRPGHSSTAKHNRLKCKQFAAI